MGCFNLAYMKCEGFIDCFCSCELLIALLVLFIWLFFTIKEARKFIDDSADIDNNKIKIENINDYIRIFNLTGIKAYLLRFFCRDYKEDIEIENTPQDKKTQDLLSIANTLIETAKNHETITFSELCDRVLQEEWKGRKWLNYIAKRLYYRTLLHL